MQIHNKKELIDRRRDLRKSATPAERRLWSLFRNNKVLGRKFKRQHSIGWYIADFYCASEKLVIELDGAVHFTSGSADYDAVRANYLLSLGIRTIRFENDTVFKHPVETVMEIIRAFQNPVAAVLSGDGLEKIAEFIVADWLEKK